MLKKRHSTKKKKVWQLKWEIKSPLGTAEGLQSVINKLWVNTTFSVSSHLRLSLTPSPVLHLKGPFKIAFQTTIINSVCILALWVWCLSDHPFVKQRSKVFSALTNNVMIWRGKKWQRREYALWDVLSDVLLFPSHVKNLWKTATMSLGIWITSRMCCSADAAHAKYLYLCCKILQ